MNNQMDIKQLPKTELLMLAAEAARIEIEVHNDICYRKEKPLCFWNPIDPKTGQAAELAFLLRISTYWHGDALEVCCEEGNATVWVDDIVATEQWCEAITQCSAMLALEARSQFNSRVSNCE